MSYVAIHSEGGLLPLDVLERIGREELPGQKAAGFSLPKGSRLTHEIAVAWSDAVNQWDTFKRHRARVPEEETGTGNLGTTCRRVAAESASFDGRFRRLLACDREEICERLRPVVLAARARGIPINHEALFADLHYWSSSVKARWAREYWGAPEGEESALIAASEAPL